MASSDDEFSRRQFLAGTTSLLLAGLGGLGIDPARADEAMESSQSVGNGPVKIDESGWKYLIAPWKGDDFTSGHKMRMKELPPLPTKSEGKVDFVIIGGGISGLSSAYFLNNHDYLLLEQYPELGGQSRGGSHNGIAYSIGAAYLGQTTGDTGKLLSELKLTPVPFTQEKNSWYFEGKWLQGIKGDQANDFYRQFKQLTAECKEIWDLFPDDLEAEMPLADAELAKLDKTLFAGCLKGYSPEFLALLENMVKSASCGSFNHLSALTAYWTIADVLETTYVLPGGNPALARALSERLKSGGSERLKTGTFVWSIEPTAAGATVTYTDKDGLDHRIDCKHVIACTPPLVTARIIRNIPDKDLATLLSFKYGSYLVANFLLNKKSFDGAYDNCVSPPFSFSDIVVAEKPYESNKTYEASMGSVLTVYQPYLPASAGRSLLLAGDRKRFAGPIADQVSQLCGDLKSSVASVVLSRWGHAMTITGPGYYGRIQNLRKSIAESSAPYSLAHCSMHGVPCAESAIAAARKASNRALQLAASGK